MAKLPKRVTNVKKKEKHARSWAKNTAAKALRIASQRKREEHNREVGLTGKQRDNTIRMIWGSDYRSRKRQDKS